MAELHKNQVAWAAPEPVQVKLAKKQDYVSSAIQQLAEATDKTASLVAKVEDAKIDADMKATQDEALFKLSNAKRLDPKEYVKDKEAAVNEVSQKLYSYSPSVRKRFLRENPQYMQMFGLSADKVVLDKQTKQTTNELRLSLPQIASDAVKSNDFYGGLKKIQEAAVNLPAEEANEILFDYRHLYDEGLVMNAAYTKNFKAVQQMVDDPKKLQKWGPARRAEFLKQVQRDIDADVKEARAEFKAMQKETKDQAIGSVKSYLVGLAYNSPGEFAEVYNTFINTGRIISYDENQNRVEVDFNDVLSREDISLIRQFVDSEKDESYVYADAKARFQTDLANTKAILSGQIAEGEASAAMRQKWRETIFSDAAYEYLPTETLLKEKQEYYEDLSAFEESWGPTGINAQIVRGKNASWWTRAPWTTKKLSALGQYQAGLSEGKKTSGLTAEELASMQASGVGGMEPTVDAGTARTASQRFKKQYKETRGIEIKIGSRGEAVTHMLAGLIQNPEYRKSIGFTDSVTDNVLTESVVSYLDILSASGQLNEMNKLESFQEDFNLIYEIATKRKNDTSTDIDLAHRQNKFVIDVFNTATGDPRALVTNVLLEPSAKEEEIPTFLGEAVLGDLKKKSEKYEDRTKGK